MLTHECRFSRWSVNTAALCPWMLVFIVYRKCLWFPQYPDVLWVCPELAASPGYRYKNAQVSVKLAGLCAVSNVPCGGGRPPKG